KVESTIDLAPDMPGYQLRIRTITFEPGGVAGFHSHKERPAFAYILQGSLTELRQGGYSKTLGPGGIITESRDVEHWAENRGGARRGTRTTGLTRPRRAPRPRRGRVRPRQSTTGRACKRAPLTSPDPTQYPKHGSHTAPPRPAPAAGPCSTTPIDDGSRL